MRLDRPLGVGARGGHGPSRYAVSAYVPGRRIQFTFTSPNIDGFHEFELIDGGDGCCVLRHTLMAHASGSLRIVFPLVVRPLHDACLPDALDRAETVTGGAAQRRPTPLPSACGAPSWASSGPAGRLRHKRGDQGANTVAARQLGMVGDADGVSAAPPGLAERGAPRLGAQPDRERSADVLILDRAGWKLYETHCAGHWSYSVP